jgi:hypothetical protein
MFFVKDRPLNLKIIVFRPSKNVFTAMQICPLLVKGYKIYIRSMFDSYGFWARKGF